jgi:hypothetical protein
MIRLAVSLDKASGHAKEFHFVHFGDGLFIEHCSSSFYFY